MLSAQASGLYYYIDNSHNSKASNNVKLFTKVFLGLYTLIIIVRIVLFTRMISWSEANLPENTPPSDSNFGVFLGNFAETKTFQVLLTLIILLLIIGCFSLSFISIRFISIVDTIQHKRSNYKAHYYGSGVGAMFGITRKGG